jgi:sulfur carrier protein
VKVTINGSSSDLETGTTVAGLDELQGPGVGRGIAVAINGEVVTRTEWATRELREGDRVEVLHAIGGGC